MRVLQITSKPMLPSVDGGNMASKALYDLLVHQGFHVDYATCFSEKHPLDPSLFETNEISLVGSFSVNLQVKFKGSLKALLTNQSYHVARFVSGDFSEWVEFHADEYDVVIFDGLFSTTPLLRGTLNHRAKFWLRSHNLEHQIWQDEANGTKNPIKKKYLQLLAKQLESYENYILKSMDGVLTIREKDILHYNSSVPNSHFLPFLSGENQDLEPIIPSFYFLGAMNWVPNQEAVKTVTEQIFPSIQKKIPEAALHIAGSFMDQVTFRNTEFVQHGFVEDLDVFYQKVSILIAPIESGSGVKIKVLEALQRGKIVLASQKAAEGISESQFPNLLICRRADDYVQFAHTLFYQEDFLERISKKIQDLKNNTSKGLDLKTIFAENESNQ